MAETITQGLAPLEVRSEVGNLRAVLVGSPSNFRQHVPINPTQETTFSRGSPSIAIMKREHGRFLDLLRRNGVEILHVPELRDCPNQIFVRDVLAVLGNVAVICKMSEPLRTSETQALEVLLRSLRAKILPIRAGTLEGGDVVRGMGRVFVGISSRTNYAAFEELGSELGSDFDFVPIELAPGFTHLDLVFNILGHKRALIFRRGIKETSLRRLENEVDFIEVYETEQRQLATNVVSLSPDRIIVESRQKRVAAVLRELGYEALQLRYSEIGKLGGSFNCSTSPLNREKVTD